MSLQKAKLFRWLDVYIGLSFLFILLASISLSFIPGSAEWLDSKSGLLNSLISVQCVLLLLWMSLGGQRSSVWNWLPPFCFFRTVAWTRWLIILMLIAGTIAGMVGKHALRSGQIQRSIESGRE